MELTSFYQNVFYSSSLGEGLGCEEDQKYREYQHYSPDSLTYQADISPAFTSYSPSPCSTSPQSCSSVSPPSDLSFQASPSPSPRQYRGEKTNKIPKIPPLEVLQQRRLAANARERKRANKINFAFNRLRKVLPGFNDREISKFEAIQLARNYIAQLTLVLQADGEQGLESREGEEKHKQF